MRVLLTSFEMRMAREAGLERQRLNERQGNADAHGLSTSDGGGLHVAGAAAELAVAKALNERETLEEVGRGEIVRCNPRRTAAYFFNTRTEERVTGAVQALISAGLARVPLRKVGDEAPVTVALTDKGAEALKA